MITTTNTTITNNKISTTKKNKLPTTQKTKKIQNIPYTITINNIITFNQSYLNLPKNNQLSYLNLKNKIKTLLYNKHNITPKKIQNTKSTIYTIT